METAKTLFAKVLSFLKPLFDIYHKQTKVIKVATTISFGIGFLTLNQLYKNYNYHKKQFPLTPNHVSSKAILITGCGAGIGQATAYKFNQLGFIVIATCRTQESVDDYLSDTNFTKNGSIAYKMDIALHEDVLSTKTKIKSFLDDNNYILWALVNNAGAFVAAAPFEWHSHDSIKKHTDVNVYGTMNVCHQFIPLLYGRCNKINGYKCANGGRIVNIGSLLSVFNAQSYCLYSATKAAISHFSQGLRIELSPRFGIWCSVMNLGGFKTKMTDTQNIDDGYNQVLKSAQNKGNIAQVYDMEIEQSIHEDIKTMVDSLEEDLNVAVDDIIHSVTARYPKRVYASGQPLAMHIIIPLVNRYQSVEKLICCGACKDYSR
eukprot:79921_1